MIPEKLSDEELLFFARMAYNEFERASHAAHLADEYYAQYRDEILRRGLGAEFLETT